MKKTIPGFTYEGGYTTGNTTKPTSGAKTTVTVSADGSLVINLYYRRNFLKIKYNVNGGTMATTHGDGYSVVDNYIAVNSETVIWKGVYGSKVGNIISDDKYEIDEYGLADYNNPGVINLEKSGYRAQSKACGVSGKKI